MKEKFISIDYEVWKNKYLPIEDRLLSVQKELDVEKIKKKIIVQLWPYHYYMGGGTTVGTVEIKVKGISVNLEQREFIIQEFNRVISDMTLLTLEDFTKKCGVLREEQAKLEKYWLNIEKKTSSLPRWVRWICGIKRDIFIKRVI